MLLGRDFMCLPLCSNGGWVIVICAAGDWWMLSPCWACMFAWYSIFSSGDWLYVLPVKCAFAQS